jgi:hypothetical protein
MPPTVPHVVNWQAGWTFVLCGFFAGAVIGLGFAREDFLGGYASLRRRMARLGHIALVALGVLNVLYGLSPVGVAGTPSLAGMLLIAGAVMMPVTCFLTAWRPVFRHAFAAPVLILVAAVILILREVHA